MYFPAVTLRNFWPKSFFIPIETRGFVTPALLLLVVIIDVLHGP